MFRHDVQAGEKNGEDRENIPDVASGRPPLASSFARSNNRRPPALFKSRLALRIKKDPFNTDAGSVNSVAPTNARSPTSSAIRKPLGLLAPCAPPARSQGTRPMRRPRSSIDATFVFARDLSGN